ncbi:DUF4040 domain-containing protein [Myxococcota bacterium]|nr:DUF4040 domain-containing protein [Myxococcota bacterium]
MTTALVLVALAGLAAPYAVRVLGARAGLVLALAPLAVVVELLGHVPEIAAGSVVTEEVPWVPSLGIAWALRIDGLALLFALLVNVVGALVPVYAASYLDGKPRVGRVLAYLSMFIASMTGLVVADDLVVFFVFWELTGIFSYLLIGWDHERADARKSALTALLVTGAGALVLFAGLVLVAVTFDVERFSELVARRDEIREHAVYPALLACLAAGAFTKSAQVPFHFWLPGAMAAPSPVSALLHSATLVKAGIYLLARVEPALGDHFAWTLPLCVVGSVTILAGGIGALAATDLKKVLAHSTVVVLGALVVLLGIGTTVALEAALVLIVIHALYKSALFLVVGSVDHEAGSRERGALGGLARMMPVTAIAAVAATLSKAGLPPSGGFVAKELVIAAALDTPMIAAAVALSLSAAIGVAVAIRVGARPFFGAPGSAVARHEAPWLMTVPPMVLAVAGLVLGLISPAFGRALIGPALASIDPAAEMPELALWHGLTPALGAGVVAIIGGWLLHRLTADPARLADAAALVASPRALWDAGFERVLGLGAVAGRALSTLELRPMIVGVLVTAASLGAFVIASGNVPAAMSLAGHSPLGYLEAFALVALVVSLGAALTARRTTVMITALAGVGFVVSMLFVRAGAPDVALTQLVVETLLFVFAMFVLTRMRRAAPAASPTRLGAGRIVVAAAVGLVMTGVVLAMVSGPLDPSLARWFVANSAPEGMGANVVNVIIVDFRALDTFGEITVLGIAAIAIVAIARRTTSAEIPALRLRPPPFAVVGRPVAIALVVAGAWLFLRGHDAPGGGFIGGLVAGAAAVTGRLLGLDVPGRIVARVGPARIIAIGLACVLAAAVFALPSGGAFFEAKWSLSALARGLPAGTPVLFDLGVFLVVFGFVAGGADALTAHGDADRGPAGEGDDRGRERAERTPSAGRLAEEV